MGRPYPQEFRNKVISDAAIMGLVKAAQYNNVSPQALVMWCKKQNISFRYRAATKICIVCGKEFKYNKKLNRVCCSKECKNKNDYDIRHCVYCGKEFKVIKSKTKKYCSHDCYAKSNRITNHAQKRRGSNWNTIRRNFKKNPCLCKVCNKNMATDLHHIIPYKYFNKDWERANNETNLVALCKDCHYIVERYVRRVYKAIELIEDRHES